MGVAGLWEVLRPAAEVRSLTQLAVMDGFVANPEGKRGFRIGIDASIWFFHAAYGREGENPELRTLFFRCCRLLQMPLLPLFVFDGPKRPSIKRGKRIGGNAHWMTTGMKNIIQAFGFEWRTAPGEAEAELAYLNRIGVIDAVLSDDVDTILFGATMVIRNPSSTLSGNRSHPVKNSQGRDDGNHVLAYCAASISAHPSVGITRFGAILVALLSGGDYIPAGLPGCGRAFAVGLARAGFGESLAEGATTLRGEKLDDFLDDWRDQIKAELRTNKSGCLPSKKPSLANSLPESFPSIPVLLSYISPITSETERTRRSLSVSWPNDPDPAQIAALCELYFEWGVKDAIVKRFRTVLWMGIVCRALRRATIEADRVNNQGLNNCLDSSTTAPFRDMPSSQEGPSDNAAAISSVSYSLASFPIVAADDSDSGTCALVQEVLSIREHASTDNIPEYRVLIDPTVLVDRTVSGIRGIRPPLEASPDDGLSADSAFEEVDEIEGPIEGDNSEPEMLETAAQAKAKRRPKQTRSAPVAPVTALRLWLPTVMVRAVAAGLADAYEQKARQRALKKVRKGITSGVGPASQPRRGSGTAVASRGARKAAEAQNEDYECFDLSDASPCSEDDLDRRTPVQAKPKKKDTAVRKTVPGQLKGKSTVTVDDFFATTKRQTGSSGLPSKKQTAARPIESKQSRLGGKSRDPPSSSTPLAGTEGLTEDRSGSFKQTQLVLRPFPLSPPCKISTDCGERTNHPTCSTSGVDSPINEGSGISPKGLSPQNGQPLRQGRPPTSGTITIHPCTNSSLYKDKSTDGVGVGVEGNDTSGYGVGRGATKSSTAPLPPLLAARAKGKVGAQSKATVQAEIIDLT